MVRRPPFPPTILCALALLLAAPGCSSCVDQPAKPVTLRLVNKFDTPIYVADDFEQSGLSVEHDVGSGDWTPMAEFATCDCQECKVACDVCECPVVPTYVRRVAAGDSADRIWQGEYRSDDRVNCNTGDVKTCLGARLAAQPGTYRLKLCWYSSVSGAPAAGNRFEATLEGKPDCVTKTFEIPSSEPIVIETDEPPGCRGPEDCPSDQMCLGGACTASCPENLVPALGADWTVEVGQPDNYGFFEVTDGANGAKIYRGTGTVENARYTSGTTNLSLTRTANGIDYTASFYYTLPAGRALPLSQGDAVEVAVIDYVSGSRLRARAVSILRDGKLALAADNGYDGPVLDAAATAPFVVSVENDVFACNAGDCGKRFHRRFQAVAGDQGLVLDAGEAGKLKVGSDDYELVSVANYRDEVDGCGPRPMTPYVILLSDPVAE